MATTTTKQLYTWPFAALALPVACKYASHMGYVVVQHKSPNPCPSWATGGQYTCTPTTQAVLMAYAIGYYAGAELNTLTHKPL